MKTTRVLTTLKIVKKLVLSLVLVLVIGGLIIVGIVLSDSGPLGDFCKTNPSLLRFAVLNNLCTRLNLNATLKCSYDTHICENVNPRKDSGGYKITITVNGKPGKGVEVDMGVNSGPTGDSYIKTTDKNGVAFFKGIPPGVYYQGVNLENFPKEYGDAYKTWTWARITIVEGKMAEMKMDLHTSSGP